MRNCPTKNPTKIFAAGISLLVLAGCNRDNVKVYHVANDQTTSQWVTQVQSLRQSASSMPTNSANQTLPPGHPDISRMSATAPVENQNANSVASSIWTIPPDWKQLPSSEFLIAQFSISDSTGAKAQVNVAELNGNGGGLEANVNRWRGQLGLQSIAEILTTGLSPTDTSGAQVVDFSGTNSQTGKPARLIGAIVPQSGTTWFYKLMGDEKIVAQQKDAFLKFVQSAKYPDAR